MAFDHILCTHFPDCQILMVSVLLLSLKAFAWFSDLLVEHSEIFWSLFGVDMDSVLNEQPPDT